MSAYTIHTAKFYVIKIKCLYSPLILILKSVVKVFHFKWSYTISPLRHFNSDQMKSEINGIHGRMFLSPKTLHSITSRKDLINIWRTLWQCVVPRLTFTFTFGTNLTDLVILQICNSATEKEYFVFNVSVLCSLLYFWQALLFALFFSH